MKVCKDCRNKVWGDGLTYLPQVCIDCKYVEVNGEKEPSNWKPKTMTNADRIRAMSDEELEAFLIDVDLERAGSPFITEWGKWLKQPAEVDNG